MSDEKVTPAASESEPVAAAPPSAGPGSFDLSKTMESMTLSALEAEAAAREAGGASVLPMEPTPTPIEDAPNPALPDTGEYAALSPSHSESEAEPDPSQAEPEPVAPPEPEFHDQPSDADTTVAPALVQEPSAEPTEAIEPPAPAKKKRTREKASEPVEEPAAAPEVDGESRFKWYVVKVQSGREESIKSAVERKVKIEGLEEFFGRIEIPVEEVVEKRKVKAKVKDKKTGEIDTVYQEKNVSKKRKKYPGYLFAEVDFNDRILYVFRETGGVGDFVGATLHRAPAPMPEHEVQSMLTGVAVKGAPPAGKVKVKLDYEKGDKVKIRDGAFSGMEGEVKHISEAKDASETPKVKVEVTIFGRPVEVELDYWQVDKA